MKRLLSNIKIQINNNIYQKDPETSDLGKKIVEHSIILIHEIGFESFTFKKLGHQIHSNESSIYRYFENKQKLLLYLTSWYWSWLEYQLVFATSNVVNPKDRLLKAIEVLTSPVEIDPSFEHINEILLHKIVINEFSKSYLTKEVDEKNKEGYYSVYKRLTLRIKDMIAEMNPLYMFPSSLASMIVEGALHQGFLKDHFESITDCSNSKEIRDFLVNLTINTLKNNTHVG